MAYRKMKRDDILLLQSIEGVNVAMDGEISDQRLATLSKEQRRNIIGILLEEFSIHGLGDGDEPNEYGNRIESIVELFSRDAWE